MSTIIVILVLWLVVLTARSIYIEQELDGAVQLLEEQLDMTHCILNDPGYKRLEVNLEALANQLSTVGKIQEMHKKYISEATARQPIDSINNSKECKCAKRAQRIARDNKSSS